MGGDMGRRTAVHSGRFGGHPRSSPFLCRSHHLVIPASLPLPPLRHSRGGGNPVLTCSDLQLPLLDPRLRGDDDQLCGDDDRLCGDEGGGAVKRGPNRLHAVNSGIRTPDRRRSSCQGSQAKTSRTVGARKLGGELSCIPADPGNIRAGSNLPAAPASSSFPRRRESSAHLLGLAIAASGSPPARG